jgi:hypothetical protein
MTCNILFSQRYTRSMPRVYASFQHRRGWYVSFLESDLQTSLRKHLTFASEHKIVELAVTCPRFLNH